MSRDINGSYTLPLAAVVSGTIITSEWGNTTTNDIAIALTDSLSKSGKGGMTAPFRAYLGTQTAPGITFANDTNSGFYLDDDGHIALSVEGVNSMKWTPTGVRVWDTTTGLWVPLLGKKLDWFPSLSGGFSGGNATNSSYSRFGNLVTCTSDFDSVTYSGTSEECAISLPPNSPANDDYNPFQLIEGNVSTQNYIFPTIGPDTTKMAIRGAAALAGNSPSTSSEFSVVFSYRL